MITGHVHVRDDADIESSSGRGRSINLGTWLDRPCYFRLDEDGGRLFELNDDDMAQLALPAEAVATNQT